MKRLQIGIIGSAGGEEYPKKKPKEAAYQIAYEIGKLVAKENAILVCGGKAGVMEAACRGAKEYNGLTVGIIGGNKRNQTNKYIDVEIVSGMVNYAEDTLIVSMCDGLIAVGGGSGTLQEITIAYRNKKPVITMAGIEGWADKLGGMYIDDRELIKIKSAKSPHEAVRMLLKQIKQINSSEA